MIAWQHSLIAMLRRQSLNFLNSPSESFSFLKDRAQKDRSGGGGLGGSRNSWAQTSQDSERKCGTKMHLWMTKSVVDSTCVSFYD